MPDPTRHAWRRRSRVPPVLILGAAVGFMAIVASDLAKRHQAAHQPSAGEAMASGHAQR